MKINSFYPPLLFFFISTLIFIPISFSKPFIQGEKDKKNNTISFNPKKNIKLFFFSKKRNNNLSKKEHIPIFLKEKQTQKLIRLNLEETRKNSSLFEGVFFLQWKKPSHRKYVSPPLPFEVFIPKPQFISRDKNSTLFAKAILEGKIQPHLYILNPTYKGQKFYIFESKEKMNEAIARTPAAFPFQVFIENQRYSIERKEYNLLSEKEKMKILRQARELESKAFSYYEKENFLKAENLFKKILDKNPKNGLSHLNYAISLYKNNKFKEALTQLYLFQPKKKSTEEKISDYYKALIFYRIKEIDRSLFLFRKIRMQSDKNLSPLSAFYEGMILSQKKKWKDALFAFHWILEKSTNKKLRKEAKNSIQKIKNILSHFKKAEEIFSFKGSAGVLFNSNILLQSRELRQDELRKNPGEGGQYLLTSDMRFKAYETRKIKTQIDINSFYLYSFKDKFSHRDPFYLSLALPSRFNLERNEIKIGESMRWLEFSPQFETLYMDIYRHGKRENILNSYGLRSRFHTSYTKTWSSLYEFKISLENASLGLGLEDTSLKVKKENKTEGLKSTFQTQQSFSFKNFSKNTLLLHMKASFFPAKTSYKKYSQLEFGSNYLIPFKKWSFSFFHLGFQSYYLSLPKWKFLLDPVTVVIVNDTEVKKRKDFYFSLFSGFKFSLNETFSLNAWFSYSKNFSSLSAYDYQNLSSMFYIDILLGR